MRRSRPGSRARLALVALWLVTARPAARAAPDPPALIIAAAASLTDVLPRVAAARGPNAPRIAFRFDASSRLARQIDEGAPTDAFFSADVEWMDHLEKGGHLQAGSRADLLGNQLVLVVPAGAKSAPAGASDLVAPAIERLAMAGESVPAGRYGRAALTALGVWPAVERKVVSGDSVRTALGWVAGGEASAGVVYATDARVEPRVRVAFTFPAASHPPIVYPAAVIASAHDPAEARRFLDFCRSPAARALFEKAGFTLLAPAPRAP